MLAVRAATRLGSFDLDVDLAVPPGPCVALAGPSGAGKSTVLRIAAGILRPDRGRVACGADDVAGHRRRASTCRPTCAAAASCSRTTRCSPTCARGRTWPSGCAACGGPSAARGRWHCWSASASPTAPTRARRRSRAASASASRWPARSRFEPSALLLDEPLSALDSRSRARAARELKRTLAGVEVPTLLVTHDFNEAALLGDEVGVIDAGRVVQRGTPQAVAAEPATAFVADFTGAVVLTGTARPGPDRTTAGSSTAAG